jgi:hypothetical protein
MSKLTHSAARGMAEAMWGTGGTNSEPTNTPSAFYFSCSGHGGFIIGEDAITPKQQAALAPYITPELCTLYGDKLMHPYRRRKISATWREFEQARDYKVYVFEEDCDWALVHKFTTIRLRHPPHVTCDQADDTFNQYHRGKEIA